MLLSGESTFLDQYWSANFPNHQQQRSQICLVSMSKESFLYLLILWFNLVLRDSRDGGIRKDGGVSGRPQLSNRHHLHSAGRQRERRGEEGQEK